MRGLRCVLLFAFAWAGSALAHAAAPPQAAPYGSAPGERVTDVQLADAAGTTTSLRQASGRSGLVLLTFDEECPVSKRYAPRVARMAREFRARGFRFALLDVTPHGPQDARRLAASVAPIAVFRDPERRVASALQARTTSEAFVIDAAGTHATAWYDNSRRNPWNPDPAKAVRWGAQVTDEMMIGYFDFVPGP